MFEVVFDYGEHDDPDEPTPSETSPWPFRSDPFSSYRPGFEVRTTRLCRRVLMFHHLPDSRRRTWLRRAGPLDQLHLRHPRPERSSPAEYSFLVAVTQSGHRRQTPAASRRVSPVEFEYTQPVVQDVVQEVDPGSLENLPWGVDGGTYQWTDLHGEGIPGILTEQSGAWFYKRNLSPLSDPEVRFSPTELVAAQPNQRIAGGRAQFMDLAGDGLPDLVVLDGPTPGFYEHDDAEGWNPFRPFTSRVNRDTRDPNLKFVDLDGDGHADVLITEQDAFVWHPSLAEAGFGPAIRVTQPSDENFGPSLVFADGTQSIYLADMSGDGLTDLVRIRNGEVCYWPNLGYGRFGAKVTMDNAPRFDHPDQFDQNRAPPGRHRRHRHHRPHLPRTATASRCTSTSPATAGARRSQLNVLPRADDIVSIAPTDLLGNGTACLVWSSPLPDDARRPMRYVDLMGGRKPHLLVEDRPTTSAPRPASTTRRRPSSTCGTSATARPWVTRLPFPVHVVERVDDLRPRQPQPFRHPLRLPPRLLRRRGARVPRLRHGRAVGHRAARRAHRHGDCRRRTTSTRRSHVPPVHTKTWFHTGVYLGRDHVSDYFAGLLDGADRGEYFREPGLTDDEARALLLPDTMLPAGSDARTRSARPAAR